MTFSSSAVVSMNLAVLSHPFLDFSQAKNRILAGQATRVAKVAKKIEMERLQNNEWGSSAEDWLVCLETLQFNLFI